MGLIFSVVVIALILWLLKDLNVFKGIVIYPRTFQNIFSNKKMMERKCPVTQTATVNIGTVPLTSGALMGSQKQ